VMAMSLFRLSQFHMCEIQRGDAGTGNYMLRSGIARVTTTDADHADPGSPSSIVDRLIDAAHPPPAAVDSTELTQSDPPQATNSNTISEDETTDVPVATAKMPAGEALTVRERAAAVINNGKIELYYKLGVFTVIGTSDPQVVRLFPQASCSCAIMT